MKHRSVLVYVAVCLATSMAPLTARAFPMIDPPIADAAGAGLPLFVDSTGPVVATYLGDSAAYSNDLYLTTNDPALSDHGLVFNNHSSPIGSTVSLGTFGIGTPLDFRMHVNNTGHDYFLGAAGVNPDDQIHARVQDNGYQGETLVSFEDLFNGPFRFNDLSFALTNVSTTPVAGNPPATAVPEPAPLALMGAGMIALALIRVGAGVTGRRTLVREG